MARVRYRGCAIDELPENGGDPALLTPRTATVYPETPAPPDPEATRDDITTSWAVVLPVLLFVPPLGWLLLARRGDVDLRVRWAIGALSAALFLAVWAGAVDARLG